MSSKWSESNSREYPYDVSQGCSGDLQTFTYDILSNTHNALK